MSTFVYFSMPGHGHTNPTLPVIKELVDRGNRVIYYSIPDFKAKIEATGAEFRSYPVELMFDPIISVRIGLFGLKLMELAEKMTPAILEDLRKEKPDCIMYDTIAVIGKAVAGSLQVPGIAFFTFMGINTAFEQKYFKVFLKTMTDTRNLLKALYLYTKYSRKYHFKKDNLHEFIFSRGDINIVFTSSYFQPVVRTFNKSFKFVGPSISKRNEQTDMLKKLPRQKKLIYISVGTIFNDDLSFFHKCFEAFQDTDYFVVMSIGHRFMVSDLGKIPNNFLVKAHVPQLEVIQKADVFISHAGLNSISESLYYGVPLVLLPRIHEQQVNAMRVAELGAGIYLKKVSADAIRAATEKILQDQKFSENAAIIGHTYREAGGYKKAADEIVAYLRNKPRILEQNSV